MVRFREITEQDWEKLPEPKPPRAPSQWDEVLGVVESGKIVELDIPEDKLKGTRIGLARVAATRGFRLAFRSEGDKLAVRKSDKLLEHKQPKPRQTRKSKEQVGN